MKLREQRVAFEWLRRFEVTTEESFVPKPKVR
jgi:hypothetical protein